jgi:hypothetical protein
MCIITFVGFFVNYRSTGQKTDKSVVVYTSLEIVDFVYFTVTGNTVVFPLVIIAVTSRTGLGTLWFVNSSKLIINISVEQFNSLPGNISAKTAAAFGFFRRVCFEVVFL